MKKIKEELSKWRHTLCSWIRRLNFVKISVFPNLKSTDSIQSKSKSSKLFYGCQQTDSKVYVERQKTPIANSVLTE